MTLPVVGGRSCGDCTLCCKLIGIPELEKPPGTWCLRCTIGKGCQIYDTRPEACRNFRCAWLADEDGVLFSEAERPDKTMLLTFVYAHGAFPEGLWVVMENRPGAADADHAKALLLALAAAGKVVKLIRHDGRQELKGKRGTIDRAVQLMQAAQENPAG